LHMTQSSTRGILLAVSVAFLAAFLLATIFRSNLHTIDMIVNLWTPTIRIPALTTLALEIATTFETNTLVVFSIVISGLLALEHRKHLGLLLFGAMGGDALFVAVLKSIYQVTRPLNGIYVSSGFSYPSGHSAGVVVFIGILAYLAMRRYHNTRSKLLIGTGVGISVGVVGFDRVYLNVHWFSDVLGGWLFGAFWLTFAISVFVWLESKGNFGSDRFNAVANWLYVVAVGVSVLVVALGFIS